MERVIHSNSERETRQAGEELARLASPGSIVCLHGELGVGKTVFAKGFCRALGVAEEVNSPTFTIVNSYAAKRFPVYHFDLYRLESADELYEIGFDDYVNEAAVLLIEWAGNAPEAIPSRHLDVTITRDDACGEEARCIIISGAM